MFLEAIILNNVRNVFRPCTLCCGWCCWGHDDSADNKDTNNLQGFMKFYRIYEVVGNWYKQKQAVQCLLVYVWSALCFCNLTLGVNWSRSSLWRQRGIQRKTIQSKLLYYCCEGNAHCFAIVLCHIVQQNKITFKLNIN